MHRFMNGTPNESTDRPMAAPLMYLTGSPNFLDKGIEAAETIKDRKMRHT